MPFIGSIELQNNPTPLQKSPTHPRPAGASIPTMHLKLQEDAGGVQLAPAETPKFKSLSSTLPFGQTVPLSHISGPTYVTAQLLVQQVAYKLSDKIFSYS